MRYLLLFLSLVLSVGLVSTSLAGKPAPEDEAPASKKFSEQLKEEAEYLQTVFEESGEDMPPVVKRYVEMTEQEAELMARSAEALEGNQPRRAHLLRERAQAICARRGNLSEQVHALAKKTKAAWMEENKDDSWSKSGREDDEKKTEMKQHKPPAMKDEGGKKAGQDFPQADPDQKKVESSDKPPASDDLHALEKRLREIEEQEAKLNREKRELLDSVRKSAEE